jgi:hypothetical protein
MYDSLLEVQNTLQEHLTHFNKETRFIEKIKLSIIIYDIVESKIHVMNQIKDEPQYQNVKKLYNIIKYKIPVLIKHVSEVIIQQEKINNEHIELIAKFFEKMMKVRNLFI